MIQSFDPVFDEHSKILILGTAPSVKSLEQGFFYGHPQNRFWKLLSEITGEAVPADVPGRKAFLLKNGIAVWDVISTCERENSSMDGDIKQVTPVDLSRIANLSNLKIYTNGALAAKLFAKYFPNLPFTPLPSTSPANQKYFDQNKWLALRDELTR